MVITINLFNLKSYAQNGEWINYTNGDYIYTLADEGTFIWIGTNGGLVKLNKINGNKLFINKANSKLPNNFILSLAIDNHKTKWIGTDGGGLAKFDGINWTI
ncbi:MAG: hypothetical protein ACE5HX_18115, partial [bacterium]